MKNKLTTIQKTEVVLSKGKSLLGIADKILSSDKTLERQIHRDVTIIGDLMWENVIDPEEHEMNWYAAIEYAKNLRLGGYDDWRLPTIEELKSVVKECGGINVTSDTDDWADKRGKNRANESYQVNYEAKGFASYFYWSSTTNAGLSYNAWSVYFSFGYQYDYTKDGSGYVRCVRAEQ